MTTKARAAEGERRPLIGSQPRARSPRAGDIVRPVHSAVFIREDGEDDELSSEQTSGKCVCEQLILTF